MWVDNTIVENVYAKPYQNLDDLLTCGHEDILS